MLPHTYKFTVQNASGVTVAIGDVMVTMRRWKRASDGSIVFESAEATALTNAAALNTATYLDGAAQDNSTLKWEGGTVCFECTAPSGASGAVVLFFKRSCNNGVDFDDDMHAIEVERLNFSAAGSKRLTFQL